MPVHEAYARGICCCPHCAMVPAGVGVLLVCLAWKSSLAVQAVSFQEICQGWGSPVCIDMAPHAQAAPPPRPVQPAVVWGLYDCYSSHTSSGLMPLVLCVQTLPCWDMSTSCL